MSDEPEDSVVSDFRRSSTSVAVGCSIAVAAPLAVLTPTVGLLVIPSGLLALYWLRPAPFAHGGDPGDWSSRDCSLSFFLIATGAACCVLLFSNASLLTTATDRTGVPLETPLHRANPHFNHSVTLLLGVLALAVFAATGVQVWRLRAQLAAQNVLTLQHQEP